MVTLYICALVHDKCQFFFACFAQLTIFGKKLLKLSSNFFLKNNDEFVDLATLEMSLL